MDGAGMSFSFGSRRSQKSLKTCKYRGIKILITCTLGNSILKLQRKLGRPDKKNPDRNIRIEESR